MSLHRYPPAALAGDYARAGLGIAATGLPLPWLDDSPVAFAVLAALALAFLGFAGVLLRRQFTVVELSDDGISTSGARRVTFAWSELDRMTLRYFSTRRDRERGWMQLRLGSRKRGVRLESTIDGFVEIVARAAAAARTNGIAVDRSTRANLEALGLALPPDGR